MKSYRTGLAAGLVVGVLVTGAVAAGLWWRLHPSAQAASPPPAVAEGYPMPLAGASSAPAGRSPAPPTLTPLAPLQLSPQRQQMIGVTTGIATRKPVSEQIDTTGNVAVDETRLAYVQVRFSGYLQKVFADATYRYVRKGDPLFTIYSPDLVAAEHEYLVARQSAQRLGGNSDPDIAADAASLVNAAQARLAQWNIPEREILRLKSSGQVQQDLQINSPVTGYITERQALPGKYVQPDTRLYTVADLSRIWVFVQVYQNDLGRLKAGDLATLTVDTYPGRIFTGRVDFIYPDIDTTTRTARVRLVFANANLALIPGMFVTASIKVPLGDQLVVPASGVLQTGTRNVVFIDQGAGMLQPRTVELGARAGDDFVVLKGLTAGERIVTSANFLIDSQSQLQAALGAFTAPTSAAPATGAPGSAPQSGHIQLSSVPSPPRKGSNSFTVHLTDASGAPVSAAQVTAIFFMAAMPAMGMAASRVSVTLLDHGGGRYEGTAQLATGGTWQVTIVARKGGQVLASEQLSVSVTGGM